MTSQHVTFSLKASITGPSAISKLICSTDCIQVCCASACSKCELPHAGFFYHYLLDKNGTVWCTRNVLARLLVTTIYMAIITLIACLIPFFGCVPVCFVLFVSTANPRGLLIGQSPKVSLSQLLPV